MRGSTVFGIIVGIGIITTSFLAEGGDARVFLMLPPLAIVLGGTLAAGFAGTTLEQFSKIPTLLSIAFTANKPNIAAAIEQLVEFNALSRREGLLSLHSRIYDVEHTFFRKLVRLCIDGTSIENIQTIANTEIEHITQRHLENISLFRKFAGFSPTMGIIGTVIGLITTLSAVGTNPTVLIHNIASAFIATLWGITLANIVWLPIADKLQTLHNHEIQYMNVVLSGIQALHQGTAPSVTRSELAGALPSKEQEMLLQKPLPNVRKSVSTEFHNDTTFPSTL